MENLEFFNHRKTARKYLSKEISDAQLNAMLEAAFNAPTTGGMQLYSVVVTRKEEMKKALAPCHFNQPCLSDADVVLTFCADFNRFEKWCEASGAVPGFNNLQSFMSAVFDAVIVAQQFCTIAEMNGIGTCYLGTTTYNAPDIAKVLRLPERVVPLLTVTAGYPDDPSEKADRLSADAMIHREHYRDYSDEVIKSYYAEKEALPSSAKFIAENGKQTLAQVFTDVRYPKNNNEHFSGVFKEFLKKQGF